jgi:hypothetical protein
VTREESWQVEGVTLTILRHITSMGYTVSVFRIPLPVQNPVTEFFSFSLGC